MRRVGIRWNGALGIGMEELALTHGGSVTRSGKGAPAENEVVGAGVKKKPQACLERLGSSGMNAPP